MRPLSALTCIAHLNASSRSTGWERCHHKHPPQTVQGNTLLQWTRNQQALQQEMRKFLNQLLVIPLTNQKAQKQPFPTLFPWKPVSQIGPNSVPVFRLKREWSLFWELLRIIPLMMRLWLWARPPNLSPNAQRHLTHYLPRHQKWCHPRTHQPVWGEYP